MVARSVLRIGDPRLLLTAEAVKEFNTPELDAIIKDMFDSMAEADGVGLAAPQIGINKRIIIFGYDSHPRQPERESVPITVLINPIITVLDDEEYDDWEACLSVPDMCGLVTRYKNIRYTGYDQKGNYIDRHASDHHARMVQHEYDHIDGILYPQRIRDLRYFGFTEEIIAALKQSDLETIT